MPKYSKNYRPYDNYLANENWKCSKSPTNAHLWVITKRKASCEYCGKVVGINSYGLMDYGNSNN